MRETRSITAFRQRSRSRQSNPIHQYTNIPIHQILDAYTAFFLTWSIRWMTVRWVRMKSAQMTGVR